MIPDNRRVACQDCGWTGTVRQCEPIAPQHLPHRVAPGDTMPAGECPECGASAMLDHAAPGPSIAVITVTNPEQATHFGVRSTAQSLANVMAASRSNRDYAVQDMDSHGFRVSVKKYSPYNRMLPHGYLRVQDLEHRS